MLVFHFFLQILTKFLLLKGTMLGTGDCNGGQMLMGPSLTEAAEQWGWKGRIVIKLTTSKCEIAVKSNVLKERHVVGVFHLTRRLNNTASIEEF